MAKNSVADWSTTAANNTDVGGVNIGEGCPPSGINNAIRTVMAQVKDYTNTAVPRGKLFGLTLANSGADSTNDIDIAVGEAASEDTAPTLLVLASALTKRLDAAWAVGTNQGGLDAGSIANATYFVWLIKRPDTGVVDALFSLSASSPTMPDAAYTLKRRIGAIRRISGSIRAFYQRGNQFLIDPVAAASVSDLGATAVLYDLTVPIGIKVDALVCGFTSNSAGVAAVLVSSPDQADTAPTSTVSTSLTDTAYSSSFQTMVRTNTSGQIRARSNRAATTFNLTTLGWIDTRGQDA